MTSDNSNDEIVRLLKEISGKLDRILMQGTSSNDSDDGIFDVLDVMTLLTLPDHLRETATALFELGSATAEDLAKKTHKERAVESNYLNQLVRMGHVVKSRSGRKVYFSIGEGLGK
ncbi:transcriptional regulator [Methanococcoides sp. FTZ1]|uniref:transcriptional regulator n=1 Tax=Methanococcoides sp. FTZ1 TaxID=3439061 RepID=UPI003F84B52B